jgi:hypothetical protein
MWWGLVATIGFLLKDLESILFSPPFEGVVAGALL